MISSLSLNRVWPLLLVLVLSFLGFADATYLTISHYSGTELACQIFTGCETVTTSAYSMIGPIPVALIGAIFYLAVMVLIILTLQYNWLRGSQVLFVLGLLSFGADLYFVSLQLFVIKAICLYCMISAVVSTLIFITVTYHHFWRTHEPV